MRNFRPPPSRFTASWPRTQWETGLAIQERERRMGIVPNQLTAVEHEDTPATQAERAREDARAAADRRGAYARRRR